MGSCACASITLARARSIASLRCWRGPRAAETSARHRFRRQWPAAGIAPLAGVVAARRASLHSPKVSQTVKSRSMVNGPSPGPASVAQARASSSRLARSSWRTVTPPETPQESPQSGRRLDHVSQHTPSAASARRIGVVNAVATSQRRCHQGHHLVASVGAAQVNVAVHQSGQTQVLGQRDRKEQPSIGHQAVIVKGDLDAVGLPRW